MEEKEEDEGEKYIYDDMNIERENGSDGGRGSEETYVYTYIYMREMEVC